MPQPQIAPLQPQYIHPSHQGSYNGTRGNQAFRLEVAQQPERARMCGFGDKVRCSRGHDTYIAAVSILTDVVVNA